MGERKTLTRIRLAAKQIFNQGDTMKKSTMIVLAAALLSVSAGYASEFSGGRIGAKAGTNRADITGVSAGSATTYGFEGGYSWDIKNVLLGIDGFVDFNQKAVHGNSFGTTTTYGSDVSGVDLKLGLPKGKWLPYAKVGYGSNKWTGAGLTGSAAGTHMGLGVEYKFAPSWSAAGEYTAMTGSASGLKSNNNNFTIGVNYYFEKAPAAPVIAAPVVKEVPKPVPVVPAKVVAPKVIVPKVIAPVVAAPEVVKPQPKEVIWKTLLEEKPVTFSGVNFDAKSAKLLPAAQTTLNDVAEFAKRYPDAQLTISGHTDFRKATSKKAYNLKLSMRRASSFKAALVKRGVAAKRISIEGLGYEQPIADNATAAGRSQNRRVVVRSVITEEKKVPVTE